MFQVFGLRVLAHGVHDMLRTLGQKRASSDTFPGTQFSEEVGAFYLSSSPQKPLVLRPILLLAAPTPLPPTPTISFSWCRCWDEHSISAFAAGFLCTHASLVNRGQGARLAQPLLGAYRGQRAAGQRRAEAEGSLISVFMYAC